MQKFSTIWRDFKIITRAIWRNLVFYATLLIIAAGLLRLSGAYPRANWLDLLVDSFHMTTGERVVAPGDGVMPVVLTFVLPLLSLFIVGEGVLRVLSVFIARGKNREEWDKMVVETFSNHMVICGVGELGKALVKRLYVDHPTEKFVLVDMRPGLLTEIGLSGDNIICIQADMTNIETLQKVNCHKARLVLIGSGNDASNLETAYKVLQLNPTIEIWVRLHHSGLSDLMDLSRKPNIHFFCPYLQAADAIACHLLENEKPAAS